MGVDSEFFHPRTPAERAAVLEKYNIPQTRPILLFVGTEHPRKNLEGLFRAFSIARKRLDATLVKVSSPRQPQRRNLQGLANSLGISDRLVSLDRVAPEDLSALYAAADVLVLPSFSEGFGLPPLEAMACGTPVAVSDVTSLPEVVGNAAQFFDPRKDADIADAICRIVEDRRLSGEMRSRGLVQATRFPWERTITGLVQTYERALAEAN